MSIALQPERQSRQIVRPHLLPHPHPRNYDYSPPPRDDPRRFEDPYQPKRVKRTASDHGHAAAEVFEDYMEHQPRFSGQR